ncbi:MAG: type II secretion system protein GspJ [Stellaceae bacterium]
MTAPRRLPPLIEGFTLLELLVAISLVAVLSVLLFGGLRIGLRSADAVNRRVDHSAQIALAYDFMQAELADARPLPTQPGTLRSPIAFTGEPDRLSFVAVPPDHVALGGFQLLRVALQGQGQVRRLVVSWKQIKREAAAAEPAMLRPSILLDGVRSVEFAYFGVADRNRPPQWLDHWTGRATLPQLVRLRIAMADHRRVPDLIVAPRLAGSGQP